MSRPELAFQHRFQIPEIQPQGGRFGIDFVDRGRKHDVAAGGFELPAIGFERTRVAGQIVGIIELHGIHEDAANDYVGVVLLGRFDQRRVAPVQRAHRRYEGNLVVGPNRL